MPKFFRVALEGDTTDGRKITRQDIQDCAETFDPKLYGVRVNLEHFRGLIPGGPFDMLGDITAVKVQEDEVEIGGVKQKALGLYAQIDPLPALVDINKKKQKLFTSIEIGQNCRGTGKAFLMGCAVTDSPASFGTQALEFAAQNAGFFANRKSAADSLFVQSHELPTEALEDSAPVPSADPTGVFAAMKGFFDRFSAAPPQGQQEVQQQQPATPPAPAGQPAENAAAFAAIGAAMQTMAETVNAFATKTGGEVAALTASVAELKETVEQIPAVGFRQRPPATGGSGAHKTDC